MKGTQMRRMPIFHLHLLNVNKPREYAATLQRVYIKHQPLERAVF